MANLFFKNANYVLASGLFSQWNFFLQILSIFLTF